MLNDTQHILQLGLSRKVITRLAYLHKGHTKTESGIETYEIAKETELSSRGLLVPRGLITNKKKGAGFREITKSEPIFSFGYKGGAFYSGLMPDRRNYVAGELLNNSPCILWRQTTKKGEPTISQTLVYNELDLLPETILRLKLPKKLLTEKERILKKRLQSTRKGILIPELGKQYHVNIQELLWNYTRPVNLWAKPKEFYQNALRGRTSPADRKVFLKAKADKITTCCGNVNCINPEHLTIIPGTWAKEIYTHPVRCGIHQKELASLNRLLSEGVGEFDLKIKYGYTKTSLKALMKYAVKPYQLLPAKIKSGKELYCDNFEFSGFAELLHKPSWTDRSAPLGYGSYMNNDKLSYRDDNGVRREDIDPNGYYIGEMSTMKTGGNLRYTEPRQQALIQLIKDKEDEVLHHDIEGLIY